LWGVTLAGDIIAMRMQGARTMAIAVTAIGITILLMVTIRQRMRSIVDGTDGKSL
jgi:UDP-GlcNAc:undecaprenyl-phosphate GlcNAc-1-phosphate transferase